MNELQEYNVQPTSLLPILAPRFEHYLTLHRVVPCSTYSYAARGFHDLPVIECTRHGQKCKTGESWMYLAIPAGARLAALGSDERLYVGAQTQDRMFRGDGLDGENYHHAEMRAGNGGDTPVSFLQAGRKIEIHRIAEPSIAIAVSQTPELAALRPLLSQPRQGQKHCGYWFEQYVLLTEPGRWRWNIQPAGSAIATLVSVARAM